MTNAAEVSEYSSPRLLGSEDDPVAHAVERQLAIDRLAGYVADVERHLRRQISDELMADAAAVWHDA